MPSPSTPTPRLNHLYSSEKSPSAFYSLISWIFWTYNIWPQVRFVLGRDFWRSHLLALPKPLAKKLSWWKMRRSLLHASTQGPARANVEFGHPYRRLPFVCVLSLLPLLFALQHCFLLSPARALAAELSYVPSRNLGNANFCENVSMLDDWSNH